MNDLNMIRHENLRRIMQEIYELEEISDESVDSLLKEIRHSCLITAGKMVDGELQMIYAETPKGKFASLFTDMDEFRKVFRDFGVEAESLPFAFYIDVLENNDLEGFLINYESECFPFLKEYCKYFNDMPEMSFSHEDSYTCEELKGIHDSINNDGLEDFISDSSNVGRYEELFEKISDSTLLTLRLSDVDVSAFARDGVFSMKDTGPVGVLHSDRIGGHYATVFTSEDKMASVNTTKRKYSQIVNISQMTNYLLSDDMDGIIINPGEENLVLSREVLMEYSPLLERTCNDSRLNSAIFYIFMVEA